MNIKKIAISDLRPAKYNPRKDLKPGDKEYQKLRRSIENFGYVEPVIWNKTTGNVVGGHQRLKVLLDLGHTEINCVVVEIDAQKEKALNLALNKISGEWDEAKTAALISDLNAGAFDISLTGFDKTETDALLERLTPVSLDELLKEIDIKSAIEKPIWVTIRTSAENREQIEPSLKEIEQKGIRVERSYG